MPSPGLSNSRWLHTQMPHSSQQYRLSIFHQQRCYWQIIRSTITMQNHAAEQHNRHTCCHPRRMTALLPERWNPIIHPPNYTRKCVRKPTKMMESRSMPSNYYYSVPGCHCSSTVILASIVSNFLKTISSFTDCLFGVLFPDFSKATDE